MDSQLLVICALTFVIRLIGTLAYAAGVRTRRIAISFRAHSLPWSTAADSPALYWRNSFSFRPRCSLPRSRGS